MSELQWKNITWKAHTRAKQFMMKNNFRGGF